MRPRTGQYDGELSCARGSGNVAGCGRATRRASPRGCAMAYFVTGGTGFIGRFLIDNLLKRKGSVVHVLVRKD